MPLPETIALKYTEEDAGFVDIRAVRRQTFRIEELLDMLLSVTGKDAARIQQILKSGTVVYHFYRYRWEGIEAGAEELASLLARFPDDDFSRPFEPAFCTSVILQSGRDHPSSHRLEIPRESASRRRLLRRRTFWDALMALSTELTPVYRQYSYAFRADVFEMEISAAAKEHLIREAKRPASPEWRARLQAMSGEIRIQFICPRTLRS